jgi:dipeptidyl aminopeptidase/acylaminoacyl peptidase
MYGDFVIMRNLEKEITYSSGTFRLAGVAMLPEEGLHPGAVFIHGSGDSDRRNSWYQEIARFLASHGIAVLLPDKRGCFKSEGNWRLANFQDLAMDAIAGVKALKSQNGVDPTRVGLIGVSQGGWIAPIAAHKCNDITFIVSISGATTTPLEQLRHQVTQDLRQRGLPTAFSWIVFPISRLLLKIRWPKWPDVENFDPIPLWATLRVPALLIFGEEDEWDNVPVRESLRRLKVALQKEKCRKISVKIFKGSGHGLLNSESKKIRLDFLQLLVKWITSI